LKSFAVDPSNKVQARAITIALVVVMLAALMLVAEQPFWRLSPQPSQSRRAAVALRDDVIPFYKWGTKAFTQPYLERYYDAAFYFTESRFGHTDQVFTTALTEALRQYDSVDVYLLAHTNYYVDWVATIDPKLRNKIRLVYNTGCYNSDQAQAWLTLGARTALAHPGISDSPVFYFYFLRRWTTGIPLDQAVALSNDRMHTVFELESIGTLGSLDAADVYANSEALCFGDCKITIGD
jgi:hypothetical protein